MGKLIKIRIKILKTYPYILQKFILKEQHKTAYFPIPKVQLKVSWLAIKTYTAFPLSGMWYIIRHTVEVAVRF